MGKQSFCIQCVSFLYPEGREGEGPTRERLQLLFMQLFSECCMFTGLFASRNFNFHQNRIIISDKCGIQAFYPKWMHDFSESELVDDKSKFENRNIEHRSLSLQKDIRPINTTDSIMHEKVCS
jgi:hypothetical protein